MAFALVLRDALGRRAGVVARPADPLALSRKREVVLAHSSRLGQRYRWYSSHNLEFLDEDVFLVR